MISISLTVVVELGLPSVIASQTSTVSNIDGFKVLVWTDPQLGSQTVNEIPTTEQRVKMEFILWLIAVVMVVSGIVALVRREVMWGAVLIVVGLLVGPGGVSLFS